MAGCGFPDKVCAVAHYHNGDPDVIVRTSMVVTDMSVRKGFKILNSREWWSKDIDLDDVLEEVDFLVGVFRGPRTLVLHVEGVVPLPKTVHGYNSSLVTHNDLLVLMREHPDKFGHGGSCGV